MNRFCNSSQWLIFVLVSCVMLNLVCQSIGQEKAQDADTGKKVQSDNPVLKQEPSGKEDKVVPDRPSSFTKQQKEEIKTIVIDVLKELKIQEEAQNKKNIEIQEKMYETLAEKKWMEAVKFADQLPEGEDKDGAYGSIAGNWAVQYPVEAAQWVGQQPDGDRKNRALMAIANTWMRKDISTAAQWATQLPAGETRDQILISMLTGLMFKNPEAADQLLNQLPEKKRQEQKKYMDAMRAPLKNLGK